MTDWLYRIHEDGTIENSDGDKANLSAFYSVEVAYNDRDIFTYGLARVYAPVRPEDMTIAVVVPVVNAYWLEQITNLHRVLEPIGMNLAVNTN